MANRNRIEKIAKKERKKLLKAGKQVGKGRPMAMQPSREVPRAKSRPRNPRHLCGGKKHGWVGWAFSACLAARRNGRV
jgi:hypothetical protein